MSRCACWIAALCFAACGPGPSVGGDAGSDAGLDGGPVDETAPQIREVRAALASPSVTFDLSAGSERRQIFTPPTVEIRVFASDDVTAPEDLAVTLVRPSTGARYADTESIFERGLWKLTHVAEPGLAFTIAVADEAGNETTLESTLTFPSLSEGVERTWTALEYDASRTLVGQVEQRWAAGQLCHVEAGGRGGTYRIEEDGTLIVEERHTAACGTDPGAEADTIERTVESHPFLDEIYLATSRFERDVDGTGVEGVWTRVATITEGDASTIVSETLTLSDAGTYQRVIEQGGVTTTASGTYEVETNPDYTFDYGDFLILTTTVRDASDLPTPETAVTWIVIRDGYLLVEPLVDLDA